MQKELQLRRDQLSCSNKFLIYLSRYQVNVMAETTHSAHPPATGFHKLLKEGTQDLHDQAEAGEFQSRMVEGNLAKSEFASFLTQMLHLHREVDSIYDEAASKDERFASIYDPAAHKRSALLHKDLEDLGVQEPSPPFDATSAFTTSVRNMLEGAPISVLGVLYVKEGATNGNKFVLKKIQTTLGLPEAHAVGYMDPHGMSQRKRWNQFKRDLNELALTEEEQQRCLEVARQSFQMFMDISSSVSNHFDQEHAHAGQS